MTGTDTVTDDNRIDTGEDVHHHGRSTPGAIALALCGTRRIAAPWQQALELPCCPDCAALLTRPCPDTVLKDTP